MVRIIGARSLAKKQSAAKKAVASGFAAHRQQIASSDRPSRGSALDFRRSATKKRSGKRELAVAVRHG